MGRRPEPEREDGASASRAQSGAAPRRRRLKLALAGAVVLLAIEAMGGAAYLEAGGYDVAAARPHDPVSYWLTRTMMVHSAKLRARAIQAPPRFSPAQALAGFRIYEARCVACHGAPGMDARARWADGMTPVPPFLVGASREWSPAELFWIVKNGVKMTGMPAWDRQCSDAEIWNLVAFLEALPRMDSMGYATLRRTQSTEGLAAAGGMSGPAPGAGCTPAPAPAFGARP